MEKGSICLAVIALIILFSVQPVWAQVSAEGEKRYAIYCSGCHGETGKGDGSAARSLPVKPVNHTDAAAMDQLSDQYLFDIISKGGSGVGKSPYMPAWGSQLKEKQIRDIVGHIRSLSSSPSKRPPGK